MCHNQDLNTGMLLEDRYHGPYNKLLNYALMDDSFTFFVSPQRAAPYACLLQEDVNPQLCLVVLNQEHKPLLFAEIQVDDWATEPYTRQQADARTREQYNQLIFDCPIPQLYGLCILGTSLRVYCGDKVTGNLTPDFVDHSKEIPEWDLDILSPDGLKKMQEIVAYIKTEATKLG